MHLSKYIIFIFTTTYVSTIFWSQQNIGVVSADDGQGLDLGALANIATSLGSNPQILGSISTILNQIGPKPSTSSNSNPINNNQLETITNSVNSDAILQQPQAQTQQPQAQSQQPQAQSQQPQAQSQQQQAQSQQQQPLQQQAAETVLSQSDLNKTSPVISQPPINANKQASAKQPSLNANSLNGLVSLLPIVLPTLNGLFNQPKQTTNAKPLTSRQSTSDLNTIPNSQLNIQNQQISSQQPNRLNNQNLLNLDGLSSLSTPTHSILSNNMVNTVTNVNTNVSSSIINQVLSAFLGGQIPIELIQLGLSGRVPSQLIELALSGQVPPQMIQMIITGQVPMSTINTFLSTMQGRSLASPQGVVSSSSSSSNEKFSNIVAKTSNEQFNSNSLIKLILEAFLSRVIESNSKDLNNNIKVPTFLNLNQVADRNMRRISRIVGGTLTNVASMIPLFLGTGADNFQNTK